MGIIITYSVVLVFAVAFLIWLKSKNGKKWLKESK